MDERCPKCGSAGFLVARNMLATRHCHKCGASWNPPGAVELEPRDRMEPPPHYSLVRRVNAYRRAVQWLSESGHLPELMASVYSRTFEMGGTLWLCGNGGSAADCQHLAAEYVNGMTVKGEATRPLNARALTVDTSVLTAVGNDRGFDQVFLKQLQAGVRDHDTVVFHTTSGESRNLVYAAAWLKTYRPGVARVGLMGPKSLCAASALAPLVTPVYAEAPDQQSVQLAHMMLQHLVVEVVEAWAQRGWKAQARGVPHVKEAAY